MDGQEKTGARKAEAAETGGARAFDAPFVSAAATGADWRGAAQALVAQWANRTDEVRACTLGFLYLTDSLVDDAAQILDFLRSVTGIAHWTGAVGVGVVACGVSYIDEPALAVMMGAIDPDLFRVFPAVDLDMSAAREALGSWLEQNEPMLVLLHGDPLADNDPSHTLAALAQVTGGFTAGGLASARGRHVQIADEVVEGGLSGVAFAAEVEVSTALSQGCARVGAAHRITACRDQMVMTLDGRPAYELFADAVCAAADMPDGAPAQEEGDVHLAFPVPGRDRDDYLVRHAVGLDPDEGWIAVAWPVAEGDTMMFVRRDEQTLRADLARTLLDLRERVTREKGVFAPRGAVYVSCVARARGSFGVSDVGVPGITGRAAPATADDAALMGEMGLVREILGDIAMAGFYANGEIANGFLYGYTAVVILFL